MALGLWPWAMSGAALDQIDFPRFRGSIWNSGIFPPAGDKAVKIPVFTSENRDQVFFKKKQK